MSGKIEYVVSVNDTGVSGKVSSLKTGLTGVGTAATQAATKTQGLGTGLGIVATKGGQASGVMTKLKGSFTGTATGMAGLGLGIAGVASQIVGMADAYDNLKDTELKLNTQRGKIRSMTTNVQKAELALAKMRKEGKAGTDEYRLAEQKLGDMKNNLKNKTANLTNAEDDYQRAQRAFYLQIGPQILGIMAQMGSSILIMKGASAGAGVGMEGMSKGAKVLSLALKAIPLVAIAGAILAIRNNTFGFRDALESVGVKIGQILPGLKPFLDWVHDMAAALGLTGGGVDFGKAFELLKTGFTSAIDTIMNTDWTKVLGQMMDQISNWFNTADWKILWQKFQDAVFASGDWIAKQLDDVGKKIVDWFNSIKWDDVWNAFRAALFAGGTWIVTNLKTVYEKIKTWIIGQDWIGAWQRFHDAVFAGGEWLGIQLANIVTWLKANAPALLKEAGTIITNAIIAAVNSPEAKIATGALDVWAAGAVTAYGDALVKALKSATAFLKGGSVSNQLQSNFESAGSGIDWIKVGAAWLKAALTNVGAWEWKTFNKTLMASFKATFEVIAAAIDFSKAGNAAIVGFAGAMGTALSGKVQVIVDVGKAYIIELGKAIVSAVSTLSKTATDIINGIGNAIGTAVRNPGSIIDAGKAIMLEIGKAIVAAVSTAGKWATDLVNGIVSAVKGAPVKALTDLGTWLWDQIVPGLTAGWKAFTDFLSGQKTEAGGPKGGGTVQDTVLNADNSFAKQSMDQLLAYWTRIGGDIQGIIPALKVDPKPATDLMNALAAVWTTKSTTMGAIKPMLSVDTKTATDLMTALAGVWTTKSTTIAATKPALSANNTNAFQIIDAVIKRWQSAVSTISSKPALLKANNSDALSKINAVVNAQGKIKNIVQVIKGNNSDALSKINQVVNAQGKIKNITQTITTVYKTVGSPAHTSTRVGVGAHTSTRLGTTAAVGETVAIAPLIGGGGGAGAGGMGDVNITIVNRDEFGTEKIRKFKAVLGKDRYLFGASGSGG